MTKIDKIDSGFFIWIGEDEGFNARAFLKHIDKFEPSEPERIFSSFGPAEILDEFHTQYGSFRLHHEFDEFAGTTIYSDSHELMKKILNEMILSGEYHLKGS